MAFLRLFWEITCILYTTYTDHRVLTYIDVHRQNSNALIFFIACPNFRGGRRKEILICAPCTNFWLYDYLLDLKRHFWTLQLSFRKEEIPHYGNWDFYRCTERSRWIHHTAIEIFIAVQKEVVEYIIRQLRFLSLHRKESLNISYDIIDISRLVIRLYFENCCFGCRLWLLVQFQRLVCKFVLKGLVPSHSAKSFDFSRWGIINIWINFDSHYKGLWTWSSSSN